MSIYLVNMELESDGWDYEFLKVAVTNAPSAAEAEKAAWNYAETMGWAPMSTGDTDVIETIAPDVTAIRYTR